MSIYVTVTSLFINSWSLPVTALKGKQWSLGLAPSPELSLQRKFHSMDNLQDAHSCIFPKNV